MDLLSIPAALNMWSVVERIRAGGFAVHPCCPVCVEQCEMDHYWVDLPSIPAALTVWSRVEWIRAGWICYPSLLP